MLCRGIEDLRQAVLCLGEVGPQVRLTVFQFIDDHALQEAFLCRTGPRNPGLELAQSVFELMYVVTIAFKSSGGLLLGLQQ